MFGLGVIIGLILGSVGTAWIVQRSLNRQSLFPTLRVKKATVYTPTDADRAGKNRDMVKRAKMAKRARTEKEWNKRTGMDLGKLMLPPGAGK